MDQSDVSMSHDMAMLASRRYQFRLVAILAATVGVVNLDMFGIGILMPFIQPMLHLDNTNIGIILSGFWISFASSTFLTGIISDKYQNRKHILIISLLAFSFCSVLPAIAASFIALFGARLLMGVLDGPIYVLPQSITALQSPTHKSGLNMGIVQNVGASVVGVVMAPLLVYLAIHFSWRVGFLAGVLPGLLCAGAVMLFVSEGRTDSGPKAPAGEALNKARRKLRWPRNLWLCAAISCFVMLFVTITLGFMPLFLIKVRHLTAPRMSVLLSVLGVSLLVLGVALPGISDRVGRKPVVFASGILGLALPLGALYCHGPLWVMALLFFLGWSLAGASALTFATIVCESVPAETVSTCIGIISAIGMLIGGVLGPMLAGWSSDRWGLSSVPILAVGCCLAVSGTALALRETVPRRMGQRYSQ